MIRFTLVEERKMFGTNVYIFKHNCMGCIVDLKKDLFGIAIPITNDWSQEIIRYFTKDEFQEEIV